MLSHSYATDSQNKSADLTATILAATSPSQISDACAAVASFLSKRTPEQNRWFFSITFPTLLCKIFGSDDSPSRKPKFSNGWIGIVNTSNNTELAARVFSLLSPNGVLVSSITAADQVSLVKYVFPTERLPEWIRCMLQNERDCNVLADLCPLFKGRLSSNGGSLYQVQLNVFEYYLFWFAYYPVCERNSENSDPVMQKTECSLYIKLLYAYLQKYVPVSDLSIYQPYGSSLLHYSSGYDTSNLKHAEFVVYTLINFWLVDNDFSPLAVDVCKSFGVNFPFSSVLGETPAAGLGEIVNVFVKYLNLISMHLTDGSDKVALTESPRWRVSGSVDVVKSGDVGIRPVGSWNSLIKRPLYRFILRTFIFCPMETSIKNASQVFSLWINYIEPWTISFEDFSGLDASFGMSSTDTKKEARSPSSGYSSSWQGFVLINYLFYSSLVMHFLGFAHKFIHTDTEAIVQMVSKVVSILTSSSELINLIKNVDTVLHSKPCGSSKSVLNNLYRFVPSIKEQLKDWEDGLCESDADGSFLHENWNKDLQLFSDGDHGGQQLLQLFVFRAESELHAVSGDNHARNMACLDSLKAQMGCLFGNSTIKNIPVVSEAREKQHPRDDRRRVIGDRKQVIGNRKQTDKKYKADSLKQPISDDEIAWLANRLVSLSNWLNKSLGLDQSETTDNEDPGLSSVEASEETRNVSGSADTIIGATQKFMRDHGMRVNLRILALRKLLILLIVLVYFCVVRIIFP